MNGNSRTGQQMAVNADQIFVNQSAELLERVRSVGHSIEGRAQHAIRQTDKAVLSSDLQQVSCSAPANERIGTD
jgi:hypothetical protein